MVLIAIIKTFLLEILVQWLAVVEAGAFCNDNETVP